MRNIPVKEENPTGLHKRYRIQKYVGKVFTGTDFFGQSVFEPQFQEVEPNAEYFVMRLDEGGSDIEHIKACRVGINAYADAIEHHLPMLARDLRHRYPILTTQP